MDETEKALGESLRAAKARLTDMDVQEVSIVDTAANLRRFVVMKGLGDMADIKIEKGMKLPGAARKTLMEGIAKELDRLTKLAEALGSSTIDDTATVPADVGKYLAGSALSMGGLAKQFGGDVTIPSATDTTQKRGAKMSAKRLGMLKSAHEGLGALIAQVDPAYIAEKASKPPAMDDEEDGDGGDEEKKRKAAQKAAEDAEKAKKDKDETEKTVKSEVAAIEKRLGDQLAETRAELKKLQGETPGGNARQPDGGTGGTDDKNKVTWGGDLAAEVDAKRNRK